MFRDGLAFFPILNLSGNTARLRRKDAEMDAPGVSLGLRLASTVFPIKASVTHLLR